MSFQNRDLLITVVAICYNQKNYVVNTLNSIKNQTYKNVQLIISDDGSIDGTKEIVQQWIEANFPSAIFLNHKINRGITKNLNTTLSYIKGDFIKTIGCDDVMENNALEKMLEAFKNLPGDYGVVFSNASIIDEDGKQKFPVGLSEKRNHPVKNGFVYKEMIERPFMIAASVMFRKEVMQKLEKFNEKVFYEDHDFSLRASRYFKFYYLPEMLVQYRVHASSEINSSSKTRYFINEFFVYFTNFDRQEPYREIFIKRLLFCIKNLYSNKFKNCFGFCWRAFFKTFNFQFIKYAFASLRFYLPSFNKIRR